MSFKNQKLRQPVAALAYDSIKRRILNLTLKPSEALSETRLAMEFGRSRTPVREALKRLENDGLVDVVPQQGTFVSPIRRDLLMDAQFARTALECALARVAARSRKDSDIACLKANLDRQEAAVADGNATLLFELDEQMHKAIAVAAGRPNVWTLILDIKIHMDRARQLTLTSDHFPTIISQHRAIIEMIEKRDPGKSEKAMAAHLSFVVEHFDEFVASHMEYTQERGRLFD